MKKIRLLTFIAVVFAFPAGACSSLVISGWATPDGRPLRFQSTHPHGVRQY